MVSRWTLRKGQSRSCKSADLIITITIITTSIIIITFAITIITITIRPITNTLKQNPKIPGFHRRVSLRKHRASHKGLGFRV